MKTFYSEITIDAPAEVVWSHIIDLSKYSEWNPFILSANGKLQESSVITIQVAKQPIPFKAKIIRLVPNRELTWKAMLPLGVLRPKYTQKIEPLDEGGILYTNTEDFTGPLLFLMAPVINRQLGPLYHETCTALKARVEH